MTQKIDNKLSARDSRIPLPGSYLRNIREQRNIPRAYLQRQLGLTATLFDALEADDIDRLPSPVYVKGYLRRYAELAGVRVAPVLASYQCFLEENGVVERPQVEEPSQRPLKLIIGSAVAFLLATSLVFGAILTDDQAGDQSQSAGNVSAGDLRGEQAAAAQVSIPENHLHLAFSTDSWVEVVDARDHILAVALQREGTKLELEGKPPFAVTLGYGPGVEVSYLGQQVSFDVDPQSYGAKLVVGK